MSADNIIRLPCGFGAEASASAVVATVKRLRVSKLDALERMYILRDALSEVAELQAFYSAMLAKGDMGATQWDDTSSWADPLGIRAATVAL